MTDLLKFVTDALGGLDHWNQLKTLKAHVSVTGAIWHVKGKPDVVKDIQIELPIHEQYLVAHLFGQSKRFVFTPQQVAVGDERGISLRNAVTRVVPSRDTARELPGTIYMSHISTAKPLAS